MIYVSVAMCEMLTIETHSPTSKMSPINAKLQTKNGTSYQFVELCFFFSSSFGFIIAVALVINSRMHRNRYIFRIYWPIIRCDARKSPSHQKPNNTDTIICSNKMQKTHNKNQIIWPFGCIFVFYSLLLLLLHGLNLILILFSHCNSRRTVQLINRAKMEQRTNSKINSRKTKHTANKHIYNNKKKECEKLHIQQRESRILQIYIDIELRSRAPQAWNIREWHQTDWWTLFPLLHPIAQCISLRFAMKCSYDNIFCVISTSLLAFNLYLYPFPFFGYVFFYLLSLNLFWIFFHVYSNSVGLFFFWKICSCKKGA